MPNVPRHASGGSKPAIDAYDDEYADCDEYDTMTCQYTEEYGTDDYYYGDDDGACAPGAEGAEADAAGLPVKVETAEEVARRKEAAAETRKLQAAAMERRATAAKELETTKAWLGEKGFDVEGHDDGAVWALRDMLVGSEGVTNKDFDAVAATWKGQDAVNVNKASRNVSVRGAQHYLIVDVQWGYPGRDKTTVRGTRCAARTFVQLVLASSGKASRAGFLCEVVALCYELLVDEVPPGFGVWESIAGETLRGDAKKGMLVIEHRESEAARVAAQRVKPAPVAVREDSAETRATAAVLSLMANASNSFTTSLSYSGALLELPRQVINLRNLKELNLAYCRLTTLPELPPKLEKIYLTNNHFATFPMSVCSEPLRQTLRVLDMAHNALTEVPAALGLMSRLEVLNFEYNNLEILCGFGELKRLEVIELTDNALKGLPPEIGYLPKLWRLKISANPLHNVPPEVYYSGVENVKRYLTEQSPHNLPVPSSTIGAELRAACADPALCDATVHFANGAVWTTLACVLQARAPRFFRFAETAADGSAHINVVTECTPAGLAAFKALVLYEPCSVADPVVAVDVSRLVDEFGSEELMRDLICVQRSTPRDGNKILAEALAAIRDETPLGRTAAFVVGEGDAATRFTVHRSLLCARSGYHKNMFASGLAEADMGVIPVTDKEPDAFEAFVEYMYCDDNKKTTPDNVIALLFLAVEYNVPRLRAMAEHVVGYNVDVDNVANVVQVAYFIDSAVLKNACMFFMSQHWSAVKRTMGFVEMQEELKEELKEKLASWGKRAN